MDKLIINFTPTGMIPTREMTPYVPISNSEIIEEVHKAYTIGITMVHLHASTKDEKPNHKASSYEKIIDGIKKHCPDLVICASLSGRDVTEFEKRSEVIELKPDMASLTLGSLNSPRVAIMNSPEMIKKLAEKMDNYGVTPELEVFDDGMLNYGRYLIRKGILHPPFYFNMILGMIANTQADPAYMSLIIRDLPENSLWSMGGVGNHQLPVNTFSIMYGGGVRVGLEDNIYYDKKRTVKATNIKLIRRIHHMSKIFEREIMSPSEFGNLGFYNRS